MKTFNAVLITSIQITDLEGVSHNFEPGTLTKVSITEQPLVSTTLDGISQVEGPGVITGEVDGQCFALQADEFERTGSVQCVRDPLPVIAKQGNQLRVHLRLIPGVLSDEKATDQLIQVVKDMAEDLGAKKVVYDMVTDAFDLTAEDTDGEGYLAA